MSETKNIKSKVCPNCQKSFGCGTGGNNGCWCADFPAILPVDESIGCYCSDCLKPIIKNKIDKYLESNEVNSKLLEEIDNYTKFSKESMVEGIDFHINEDGYYVFTAWYHLKRGSCCGNGCKHCPYD